MNKNFSVKRKIFPTDSGGISVNYHKKNNIDAGCFFLTNAYTYALEQNLNSTKKIHEILKLYRREE